METVNWDALYTIGTVFLVAGLKLSLVALMLRQTWAWTHVGRGLLLMFLIFGTFYGWAGVTSICQCLPSIADITRGLLVLNCLYLIWALRTYHYPPAPSHINWANLLGLRPPAEG